MHYNYVANHGTIKMTLAQGAGLAKIVHQWTIAEMLERVASFEKPRSVVELINRIPENEAGSARES